MAASDDLTTEPAAEPALCFHFPEALRDRALAVLGKLEEAADATPHRAELTDVVLALTDAGLAYYFLRPLQQAGVGFVTEQSAGVGVGAVRRVMTPVIRKVLGRMDTAQLRAVGRHLRAMMA